MLRVIPGKFSRPGKVERNLLLKKIEAAIYAHPLVAEVAVRFSTEDTLTAFIVPRDEGLSTPELKKFLTDLLTPRELPQIYRFVSGIPKSLSGKCPQVIEEAILQK